MCVCVCVCDLAQEISCAFAEGTQCSYLGQSLAPFPMNPIRGAAMPRRTEPRRKFTILTPRGLGLVRPQGAPSACTMGGLPRTSLTRHASKTKCFRIKMVVWRRKRSGHQLFVCFSF